MKELQGSETTTATPATTPRGSPANGSTPTTNTSAKKTTEKGDGHNSDDDDREEPIRTPDGVAVPWLQTHDLYNSFMYPFWFNISREITTQPPAHWNQTNPRALPEVLSHGAIRMRLRRMCEMKQSGKSHVPQEVSEDYKKGGEEREWLEIALLESIKKVGTDRKFFKQVKAGSNCLIYMHNAQFRCLSNHLYTNVPGCLYINVHSDRSIDRPSSKCEWRSSKRECCRRKRKFMGNGIPKKSWRSQGCIRSNLMALIINTILFGNIIVQLDWKWDCIL